MTENSRRVNGRMATTTIPTTARGKTDIGHNTDNFLTPLSIPFSNTKSLCLYTLAASS